MTNGVGPINFFWDPNLVGPKNTWELPNTNFYQCWVIIKKIWIDPLGVTYIVYHTYPLEKENLKALGNLGTTKDESFERIIDHVSYLWLLGSY